MEFLNVTPSMIVRVVHQENVSDLTSANATQVTTVSIVLDSIVWT